MTSVRVAVLCVVVFVGVVWVCGVAGVDRSKFKTCDQSSFCKRNRALSTQPREDTKLTNVLKESLQKHEHKITATLKTENVELPMDITVLQDNIVRLRIYENKEHRYMGPQDLLEQLKEADLTELQRTDSSYTFGFGNNLKATLSYSPFAFDLYDGEEKVITTNNRKLFNFEYLRSKAEDTVPAQVVDMNAEKPATWDDESDGVWERPLIDNPEAANRWEENFGSHKDTKPFGPTSVGLDFTFVGSKYVYGLPEHATDLALKSTKGETSTDPYRLYNLDVFEYELNNPMALYGAVPLMISHTTKRTTAIFWFNAAETWIDVSDGENGKDTHWFSESGIIDVFFLMGPTPMDIFRQYASLTGTSPLPPLFAIAYHQCKWNYKNQAEVDEVDSNFDKFNIPYDVIWLDIEHTDGKRYFTWDKHHFPNPVEMQEKIKNKGRKMVTIIDPHIKRDNNYYIHSAAQREGLYVKNHEGNEYEGHCWPGSSSWVDFVNPAARDWWANQFNYDKYSGSTNILFTWNDMNEPSVFNGPEVTMHKDAKHYNNLEHRDIHNVYGTYMFMSTQQGQIRRNPGQNERPFVLSRSFFAGAQRYGAIWTGDNAGNWDHLAIAQPMLLSLGLGGITFAGADVGGFFGNPPPELLTRWYQAGAFHPFFRAHGHLDSKRREPFLLDEPYVSIIRDAIRARYSYLPYWYTLFYHSEKTGVPVMRPLWVHYPQDESTFSIQDEFLVGSDLLVKPVTKAEQTTVDVFFPGSEPWYDVQSGEKYTSPSTTTVNAPLSKIPVFQRGGSIIPKKERPRRSSTQMKDDPITLVVALNNNQEAEGEIYMDDEHSFDYRKGHFLRKKFEFKNSKLTSTAIGSETYDSKSWIERVVIYGLQKTPSKVVLQSNSGQEVLQFYSEGSALVIRKPGVPISSDWAITLA